MAPRSAQHDEPQARSGRVEAMVLQPVTQSQEPAPFHEALHQYSLFARPTTVDDITKLSGLVDKIIRLCGTSNDAWKLFVLTAFLRRYHEKAPEAKTNADDEESIGDGERLVFYGTLLECHRFWQANLDVRPEQSRLASEAGSAMIRIAARVGGTRDLCAVIEHLTHANLRREGLVEGEDAPQSFPDVLVPAVQALAVNSKPDDMLELVLRCASAQLDQDLRMLKSEAEEANKECLSTIHVKLPHNQRGSNTRNAWQRKLANCIAEVLIWQRVTFAVQDPRFGVVLDRLRALPGDKEAAHKLIQQIQMNARKQRQLLNNHARKEGFLLTSSYQLDKTSLTLRQIRRAKVGDLKLLEKLAKKNKDMRVLQLIAKRHMNPEKAIPIQSIQELTSAWMDIHKDYGDDEIATLELAMQTSTIQATLSKLHCQNTREALVACVDTDPNNLICAILVAASLEDGWLVLGDSEHDVSTTDKCLDLINQVLVGGSTTTFDDSTMSVEDILASKLSDGQDAIILSSADLELDEKVLKDTQARDITLRVHSTKTIEAAVGEVKLSLNSTVYDRIKARQPLHLSVVLDCTGSMGGEIEGCKKGALKMISKFRELAPVECVNFLGYWDPVNVRSDPQPASTGYLDTAGFRSNENARVQRALEDLRKLGVVMVMCKVRGGGTLQTFVDRLQDCFRGVGQYCELNGVGQLESIAASVTESIRASLFQSGNVISVTASNGSTLDALRKLVKFQEDHNKLKETKELLKHKEEENEEEGEEETEVFATTKSFALTSRDRLYLQLSRLPSICHESVGKAFGGKTLQEITGTLIANRLRSEDIPLAEVQKAGYPDDVVELVKNLMGGFGLKRVVEEEEEEQATEISVCYPEMMEVG